MTEITRTLQLPDGRRLGMLQFGDPTGEPFFYFHGMPGSRYEAQLIHDQASALNLSIISLDRPGYGLSDFTSGRRLLDWPDDVCAVADALSLERFGIIGVSGGGPFALACAHSIADRLSCVALICGLGPVFRPDLLADMSLFTRSAFRFERNFPKIFRVLYGIPLTMAAKFSPGLAVHMLAFHCGGEDRKVLIQPDVKHSIATSLNAAFQQGAYAAAQEMHLYQQPWGFELSTIKSEILMWHGTGDPVVPALHSEYIANSLARATLTLVPGAGHFSLPIRLADSILGELKSRV